jgi:undecaprenyl diphosphate synthase
MAVTKKNTKAVLNLALNYGGRTEIVDAVKRVVKKGLSAAQVTEAVITEQLYGVGVVDPDLIIRTSGEQRISGFLLWEAAYAELYFTPKKWPAFTEADLDRALADYARRKRNFGA